MAHATARANGVPSATADGTDDALYRKISRRIIPFLFICYVVSFLDRINIGFTDAMYGLGAGVFYVGYVLFEVPSNLLPAKYGARKTFARIMLSWDAASVAMMFVASPTSSICCASCSACSKPASSPASCCT